MKALSKALAGDPDGTDALPSWGVGGGLLEGNYWPSKVDFEHKFVDVAGSNTRMPIYEGWNSHRADLLQSGCCPSSYCLLNGSYTTQKLDPQDLDMVVAIKHDPGSPTDSAQLPGILALLQGPGMKAAYRCDAYPLVILPEDHADYEHVTAKGVAYWLKWFGQDRSGHAKGRVWSKLSGLR